MRAGIGAADPAVLVERALATEFRGDAPRGVWVLAAGKAASAMARAASSVLDTRVRGGFVVSPSEELAPHPLRAIQAEHPSPGSGSEAAGRHALMLAEALEPDDRLLVLLSGGASSLMAVPADGISLDDKRRTAATLMREGADIRALNVVRKHLSAIKGGRLAARCPAPSLTLAISDVIGDDPTSIGSGPTVADPSTFSDALEILQHFGGVAIYPASVVARLSSGLRGEQEDTPKSGDRRLSRSATHVIGGRFDAMHGAQAEAVKRGYLTVVVAEPVRGEARQAAEYHVTGIFERLAEGQLGPLCVISSGETTVTVRGEGRGGRNQEFALALVERFATLGVTAVLASAGTDGIDGPTDAAGAIVDSTTLQRAQAAGLAHPSSYLDGNDAYSFFSPIGDLLRTGPTGTNVGDLQVFLLA